MLAGKDKASISSALDWIQAARPDLLPAIAAGDAAAVEEGLRAWVEAGQDFFQKVVPLLASHHPHRRDGFNRASGPLDDLLGPALYRRLRGPPKKDRE